MRILKNEEGIALLIVLILTAVALIISAGLLYMVLQSTRITGSMNRYKTVYEAATGGANVACELVNAGANPNIPGVTLNIPNIPRLFGPAGKLNVPATSWVGYNQSVDIDTADPDAWFTLGGLQNNQYTVYIKIIDMVGNMSGVVRGAGAPLHTSGVVQNAGSGITSANSPRLYTIEVLAQNTSNVLERARLSILYMY